jgi:hypothetical protein
MMPVDDIEEYVKVIEEEKKEEAAKKTQRRGGAGTGGSGLTSTLLSQRT